jgi:hypothetical protein
VQSKLSEDEIRIPLKRWYQISDLFTRIDEELAEVIKADKQKIELLKIIAGVEAPPVPRPDIRPITERLDAIKGALDRDYPNFIDLKEFNTAVTTFNELKIYGVGFVINDVGGGFSFKLDNQSGTELTAVAGDKYDNEFKNILVKGAGAGTGKIIYWRRE